MLEEETNRKKCKLTDLLYYASHDEVNSYVARVKTCLYADGIYPIDAGNPRGDWAVVQRANDFVLATDNMEFKLSLILFALYISPSFRAVFCPLPTKPGAGPDASGVAPRKFLCNPQLLGRFVDGEDSPLGMLFRELADGHKQTKMFVATCAKLWYQMRPWTNMDQWAKLDPNADGIEAYVHAGGRDLAHVREGVQFLSHAAEVVQRAAADEAEAKTKAAALQRRTALGLPPPKRVRIDDGSGPSFVDEEDDAATTRALARSRAHLPPRVYETAASAGLLHEINRANRTPKG